MQKWVNIRPLAGRVAVVPNEPEKVSSGGILLPEGGQGMRERQAPRKGTVYAVPFQDENEENDVEPCPVNEGDRILYTAYAGDGGITINNEDVIVMGYDNILAVIDV